MRLMAIWVGLTCGLWLNTSSAQDQWQEQCRQPSEDHDSVFEFDGHPLIVGGRPHKKSVLYCVVVQGATQEYLVNWPEAQMNRVETRNGVLAHYIRIQLPITTVKTSLEIGANAKPFDVEVPVHGNKLKPIEEISKSTPWEATTKLFASLPLADSPNSRPVDIEIKAARSADGTCHVSYIDYASKYDERRVVFKLPEFIAQQSGEPELKAYRGAFYDKQIGVTYRMQEGLGQPIFASLPIISDGGKELASVPVVVCGEATY